RKPRRTPPSRQSFRRPPGSRRAVATVRGANAVEDPPVRGGIGPYQPNLLRQMPQLEPYFAHRLVALRRIFGECAIDDIYERRRKLWITRTERRVRRVDDRVDRF